jgi:orotidine-5'-phosphate decarboxylase
MLFVALDNLITDEKSTLYKTRRLSELLDIGFKVNLDYLLLKGIEPTIKKLRFWCEKPCPIFVDLKMWNGSRTMINIIKQLIDCEVNYTNVYLLAGQDVVEKVVETAADSSLKIWGLTILSHYDNNYCRDIFFDYCSGVVKKLSLTAILSGCHGVILPGPCLAAIEDLKIVKVVPGVRPVWYSDDRHKQAITPESAYIDGATHIVVGGPIMNADDPVKMMMEDNL